MITYVGAKGEPVTCPCGASFCDIPGKPGRRRKFCSKDCSDYAGKGPGRTAADRISGRPVVLPTGKESDRASFVAASDKGRDFPPAAWARKRAAQHDHPVFSEWVLGWTDYPDPDEGQSCPRVGAVIGSDRPWNVTNARR